MEQRAWSREHGARRTDKGRKKKRNGETEKRNGTGVTGRKWENEKMRLVPERSGP